MSKRTPLEDQILEAAEELFIKNGFAGTSTTDIARKVGCNQALVHYYFRTKENLFEQIFLKKIEFSLSCADKYRFTYNGDFKQLLEALITQYFSLLCENRRLPFFILSELFINDKRREFIRRHIIENEHRQAVYYTFDKLVRNEVAQGRIRPIETPHPPHRNARFAAQHRFAHRFHVHRAAHLCRLATKKRRGATRFRRAPQKYDYRPDTVRPCTTAKIKAAPPCRRCRSES